MPCRSCKELTAQNLVQVRGIAELVTEVNTLKELCNSAGVDILERDGQIIKLSIELAKLKAQVSAVVSELENRLTKSKRIIDVLGVTRIIKQLTEDFS